MLFKFFIIHSTILVTVFGGSPGLEDTVLLLSKMFLCICIQESCLGINAKSQQFVRV